MIASLSAWLAVGLTMVVVGFCYRDWRRRTPDLTAGEDLDGYGFGGD